ncbi:FAD/FMN-containing dehydrogenase [Paenibacillus thiaminolyticus]|uniref:FAD/FMN-containing dehydrogenase n=1 Tax=Paenibacillus thiaminolyticus TaxID=49283 RepID=UPI0035A6C596
MKKRLVWVGATAIALIFGTAVYASGSGSDGSGYDQMLPHMKQMHPDMTDTQLEQMVQHCHGADREAVRSQGTMRRGMMLDQMMQNEHWY